MSAHCSDVHAARCTALQCAQAAHHLRHGWPFLGRLCPALMHQGAVGFQALRRSHVGSRQSLARRQLQALTVHNLGTNLRRGGGVPNEEITRCAALYNRTLETGFASDEQLQRLELERLPPPGMPTGQCRPTAAAT